MAKSYRGPLIIPHRVVTKQMDQDNDEQNAAMT